MEGPLWNGSIVTLVEAAKAHCRVILASEFADAVAAARGGGAPACNVAALGQLAELFALDMVRESLPTLLGEGVLDGAGAAAVQAREEESVRAVRANAVPLVDAFGHEDYLLGSSIGRRDGDVYRATFEAAQKSPLNECEEGPAWAPVLRERIGEGERGGAGPAQSRL